MKSFKLPLVYDTFESTINLRKELSSFIESTDRLSMGEECYKCEKTLSNFFNINYSLLFNSGGSANLALFQALKNLGWIKDGDKIGFSALTWSTNVTPILQTGMIPIPIDCTLETLNINFDKIKEAHYKEGLRALFITNALGFCSELDKIEQFCQKNNIILLEDNCESFGLKYKHKPAGTFGLAGTLSFFVSHQISAIEGGAILTNNKALSDMLKIVRSNGWARELDIKAQRELMKKHDVSDIKFSFFDIGFNLRPTEITGFLCKKQIDNFISNIMSRYIVFVGIYSAINNLSSKIKVYPNHSILFQQMPSPFCIPIICKNILEKEKIIEYFSANNIESRPIISGNIANQPMFKKYCDRKFCLPIADIIEQNGIYISGSPFSWGIFNGTFIDNLKIFKGILNDF